MDIPGKLEKRGGRRLVVALLIACGLSTGAVLIKDAYDHNDVEYVATSNAYDHNNQQV